MVERAGYVCSMSSLEWPTDVIPAESCPRDLEESENERTEELVSPDWCSIHSQTHRSSVSINTGTVTSCALLDSGAQLSCVAASVAERYTGEVRPAQFVIRGINGEPSPVLASTRLSLHLPGMTCCCLFAFAVVSDEMMPFCIILGADYLSAHRLTLDPSKTFNLYAITFGLSTQMNGASGCVMLLQSSAEKSTSDEDEVSRSFPSMLTSLLSPDNVKLHQKNSLVLRRLRTAILEQDWADVLISKFRRYRTSVSVMDGVIVRRSGESRPPACVVTFEFLVEVALNFHYSLGHIGRQKLIDLISQHLWHPSLSKVAADVTTTCITCQKRKVSYTVTPPSRRIETTQPFELVAIDLVSLPNSWGHSSCLVAMDHFSKWLSVVPLRSKTARSVTDALERHIIPKLPLVPAKILSDNGPEFTSRAMNELLSEYNIAHIFTTPHHPSSNGLVERANRTLIELLRVQSSQPGDWMLHLPRAIIIHNHSLHSALGVSPSQFLLGRAHPGRDVAPIHAGIVRTWGDGHPAFRSFDVGQQVLKKAVMTSREVHLKFAERFQGPYRVVDVNPNQVTYVIEHCETGKLTRAHHSQLRRFHSPPQYLLSHPTYLSLVQLFNDGLDPEGSGDQLEDDSRAPSAPLMSGGSESGYAPAASVPFLEDSSMTSNSSTSSDSSAFSSSSEDLLDVEPLCRSATELTQSEDLIPAQDATVTQRQLNPASTNSSFGEKHASFYDKMQSSLHLPEIINTSPPLLSTTVELPSGIIIERSEHFWSLSSIPAVLWEDASLSSSGFRLVAPSASLPTVAELCLSDPNISTSLLSSESLHLALEGTPTDDAESTITRSRSIPCLRSPVQTRSRGYVRGLPRVQDRPLEYALRPSNCQHSSN